MEFVCFVHQANIPIQIQASLPIKSNAIYAFFESNYTFAQKEIILALSFRSRGT
jgi:hypothetical protein